MDEKELQALLDRIQVPEPDALDAENALKSAMNAFDEKNLKTSQGNAKPRRLTHTNNPFEMVRRFAMKNKLMWSGLMGGVAVVALVGVLGAPFIREQMAQTGVNVNAGTEGDVTSNGVDIAFQSARNNKKILGGSRGIEEKIATDMAERKESLASAPQSNDLVFDNNIDSNQSVAVVTQQRSLQGKARSMAEVSSFAPTAVMAPPRMPYEPVPLRRYQDTGRDTFEDIKENAVKSAAADPVSTFSIDVDTASYSFMRRQLNNGVLPQKDAIRIEELVNYFDYDYALPEKNGHPFQPNVTVTDAPWNAQHKLVHIGIKGYDIVAKPQSNLVFLIDTSGSMNSPDKLPLLVNSFKMMLDGLDKDDSVAIVTYAGSAGTVLEPKKIAEKQKIIAALENLSAGGSTAGAAGIHQAYTLAESEFIKDGNNRIILATDGDFNVGITSPQELQDFVERKRKDGVFLSVLGFGQGNYNDALMQKLAQNGNGNAAYIDNLNEARKILVDEAASTLFTIAKDVKIQVEFNPKTVSEYRLIGYETHKLAREDFNNDAVDAGEVGSGHAVTAIYEITPVGAPKTVDDLRYGTQQPQAETEGGSEYAFLKIRYKKPDSDTSTLITRPITTGDEIAFAKASDDVRFAAAVSAFGQILKGGKYTGSMTYTQIIDLANGAKGTDEFGLRAEFINLIRLAKSAGTMR